MKQCSRCYVRWRKEEEQQQVLQTWESRSYQKQLCQGMGHILCSHVRQKQEVNSGMNAMRAPIHYCTCSLMEFRRERASAWPWMFLIRAERAKEISFWAGDPLPQWEVCRLGTPTSAVAVVTFFFFIKLNSKICLYICFHLMQLNCVLHVPTPHPTQPLASLHICSGTRHTAGHMSHCRTRPTKIDHAFASSRLGMNHSNWMVLAQNSR